MQVQNSDDDADDAQANTINNIVRDAFGLQQTDNDGDRGFEGPVAEYLHYEAARNFFVLITEGDKSLYLVNFVYATCFQYNVIWL